MSSALETWQERLEHLLLAESVASDEAQKFTLRKQIQEARGKIADLRVESTGHRDAVPDSGKAPARSQRRHWHLIAACAAAIALLLVARQLCNDDKRPQPNPRSRINVHVGFTVRDRITLAATFVNQGSDPIGVAEMQLVVIAPDVDGGASYRLPAIEEVEPFEVSPGREKTASLSVVFHGGEAWPLGKILGGDELTRRIAIGLFLTFEGGQGPIFVNVRIGSVDFDKQGWKSNDVDNDAIIELASAVEKHRKNSRPRGLSQTSGAISDIPSMDRWQTINARLNGAKACIDDERWACVDEEVEKVLGDPSSTDEQRAQAEAVHATAHMQRGSWHQAREAYLRAISTHSVHAVDDDGHIKAWRRDLASAYANQAAAQLQLYKINAMAEPTLEALRGLGFAMQAEDLLHQSRVLARQTRDDVVLPREILYEGFPAGWLWISPIGDRPTGGELQKGGRLRLRCNSGHYAAGKLFQDAGVQGRPWLIWRWQAMEIPLLGNAADETKADEGLQVLILFKNFRMLHYVWDATAPVGYVEFRTDYGWQKMVDAINADAKEIKDRIPELGLLIKVLRSGTKLVRVSDEGIGEAENIVDDYHHYFPSEEVPAVIGVGIQTRCVATKGTADGWVSGLRFSESKPDEL